MKSLIPLVIGLSSLLSSACDRQEESAKVPPLAALEGADRPNILVVDIDSLRADRLEMQRNGEPIAPAIMNTSLRGTRFTQAYSQGGWTLPGLAAILTGRYPIDITMDSQGVAWRGKEDRTLPEILGFYGYQTAVYWGLTLSTDFENVSRGFSQVLRLPEDAEPEYGRRVEYWLTTEAQEPFFFFVHNIDLHAPMPRIPGLAMHRWSTSETECGQARHLGQVFSLLQPVLGTDGASQHTIAHYDASLRNYDTAFGSWIRALQSTGRLARTIVVVISNHGEELGERGSYGHGLLFDEILHVPLIILDPKVTTPRQVDTVVQGIDLAPTLLARVGIPVDRQMDGQSLLPLLGLAEGEYEERPVYSSTNQTNVSIRTPTGKLVVSTLEAGDLVQLGGRVTPRKELTPHEEYYALDTDPQERNNVLDSSPEAAAALRTRLDTWRAMMADRSTNPEHLEVNDKARKVLKERGYWAFVHPEGEEGEPEGGK